MKIKLIFIILIFFIIGFGLGFSYGIKKGVNWTIDIGINFLKAKGIEIDVNENMLKQAIFNYKEQIGTCFNKNAFVWNNTGN